MMGNFLYVVTVHVLPEVGKAGPAKDDVDGVGFSVITHPVAARSGDSHGGLVVPPALILQRISVE